LEHLHNALDLARSKEPVDPVFCLRPFAARRAAEWFIGNFPGKTFYAVKANPSPWVLDALAAGGITHFDVASIREARMVRAHSPNATLGFMNPVKSARAISEAYHDLGVRIFSLDSHDELDKIVSATSTAGVGATDLTLCVRLRVPGEHSTIPLAKKFGAEPTEATSLLQRTRQVADALGVCFHVGSQAMSPAAYAIALDHVQQAIVRAGVIVDVVDVGGGFPSSYPGMEPPPLILYVEEIARRFEDMSITQDCELWCEPGRALSAEAASLVVCVEERKGNRLYINDGRYGALHDASAIDWAFPVRVLREDPCEDASGPHEAFCFYGPTCDDADMMEGPFLLPADIRPGDFIEIGMLGAYGTAMRTDFNGFQTHEEVTVGDEPMFSLYKEETLPDDAELKIVGLGHTEKTIEQL